MEVSYVVSLITVIVTLVLGEIVKQHPKINKKLVIPIQNLIVGVVVAIVYFIITKDFNVAISVSGLIAGGTYDLVKNLSQLIRKED